jgi:hypothetical protein
MPARMQASIVMQLSVANFIGGTTKQLDSDTNGAPATRPRRPRPCGSAPSRGRNAPGRRRTCRHVSWCRAQAGIERVEVHLEIVDDVAADHGALEEMDIVERDGRAARRRRDPARWIRGIRSRQVDHMHGGPGGAVMHPVPTGRDEWRGSRPNSSGKDPFAALPACPRPARGETGSARHRRGSPRPGHDLDARLAAPATGRWFPAHRARRWMRSTLASVSGLYCPPLSPAGRLRFSGSGAVLTATRAARPQSGAPCLSNWPIGLPGLNFRLRVPSTVSGGPKQSQFTSGPGARRGRTAGLRLAFAAWRSPATSIS